MTPLQAIPGAMELIVILLILVVVAVPVVLAVGAVLYFVVLGGGALAILGASSDSAGDTESDDVASGPDADGRGTTDDSADGNE